MKIKEFFLLELIFVIVLASCGKSLEDATQESGFAGIDLTPTTEPSITPAPSSTISPSPTLEPTPTSIVLPDVLHQYFSDINVIYRDEFHFVVQGRTPNGWEIFFNSTSHATLSETKDSTFRISTVDDGPWSGILYYYSQEVINPNEGVYFSFKYSGTGDNFTWGIDSFKENGELFEERIDGYYSVAMQMDDFGVSAHIIQGNFQGDGYFKGDLKLQEDTWYDLFLAFDEDENYIIVIWNPETPENQLVYIRQWQDFPKAYYFVSWMSATRSLWMDNFTIFSFDDVIPE